MEKEELRKLLNQPYKTENWKKISDFVFPNVSYLQTPQNIPIESDKIETFRQIGNVKLADGKNLAMFEVHVAQNVNLSRNRVELRKIVAPLIDQERNHGVLVIYEQGKEDYRFTFTAKSTEFDEEESDFVSVETDTKRFTYVLGGNESCKTAANRFWNLSAERETATIKNVENAFSVEKLNDEFFDKYKKHYEDFVQYITGKRFVEIKGKKGKYEEKVIHKPHALYKTVFEKNDKLARNFIKLLLGRLVFIQFLQKKGWMGVDASSTKWEKGEKDFLLNHFNNPKFKEDYHSKFLFPLFYKAFNTPDRPNDVFKLTNSRIPYLNGGLFENEYPNSEKIDFPEEYFVKLLDFFSQYNFTIDENDPNDHEVGIDPEMLGHIFENLLEDNKDKGAFYTPKTIVRYMCQESLMQYLKTYLQGKNLWSEDEAKAKQTEDAINNFVRKKLAGDLVNDYDEHLALALRDVKICDPAIGSGAFPMGLLNEIFQCMYLLYHASPDVVGDVWKMKVWSPEKVKKNIIQHSIYGVDIDKGAVDIARLRFWLSLIVDETKPTPLPNLDFKIMQGDSLLESYEGIDLSVSGKVQVTNVDSDLFGNALNAQLKITDTQIIDTSNIQELIEDYFNAQKPDEKQKLKKEIDKIIHKHIDFNLEFEENKILLAVSNLELKIKGNKILKSDSDGIKRTKIKNTDQLNETLIEKEEELKELQKKRRDLHELQNKSERPYFLWHLFFKDVFEKNGGFDIVIGNPPYISNKKINKKIKVALEPYYHTATGQYDLFSLFIEKALLTLNKVGCHAFIIPDSYIGRSTFKVSRKLLLEKTSILNLLQINEVFKEANVSSLIYILKNGSQNKIINCQKANTLTEWLKGKKIETEIPQSQMREDPNYKLLNIGNNKRKIIYQLLNFPLLGDKANSIIWRGEEIGRDSDKIVSTKTTHPIIDGGNISPFSISEPDCYILKRDIEKDLELYSKNKIVVRQLGAKINAAIDKNGFINLQSTYNIIPLKYDIYFCLAILNSNLIDFIYQNYIKEKMEFPRVLIENLAEIPIAYDDDKLVAAISIAGKTLSKKPDLDLMQHYNTLVYKLYRLSFADIQVVEPNCSLSEQQYNNYKIA